MNINNNKNNTYYEINAVLSIRKYRLYMELSQEQIANYLNITRSTYTRFENADKRLELYYLNKLCKLYDVPLDAFYLDITPDNYDHDGLYRVNVQRKIMNLEVNKILEQLQGRNTQ